MQMLINSGCDINHQNKLGETGLIRALIYGASMQDLLPVITLLLEHGCNTDLVTKDNISAARLAYSRGHIECLKLLAEANARDSR